MPSEEYGKQFSKLRELFKEAESLGARGIKSQEPNIGQNVDDALNSIVQNVRQMVYKLDFHSL